MWFVYILRCVDQSLYIGATQDVARRLDAHNEGSAAAHTARRRPVHLVYVEQHATRATCLARERQLKGWTRAKKEALIAGDKANLKRL
jgi:predicted GIY-YIG superfamily endonuclease